MSAVNFRESAAFIRENIRLKTLPVSVKFLQGKAEFPEKARRPSVAMGKRVAICQGVTMARRAAGAESARPKAPLAASRRRRICQAESATAFGGGRRAAAVDIAKPKAPLPSAVAGP